MKSNSINIKNQDTNTKTKWTRPMVSQIDIKRTLSGAGGYTDGTDFQALP